MYYHFAFLAISIALFGLSASGVYAYVARAPAGPRADTARSWRSGARSTPSRPIVALFLLVRLRVGLNYSPENLRADAGDLRAGGAAVLHRRPGDYARHLAAVGAHQRASTPPTCIGAAPAASSLIPLLNRLGAPGVVLAAAALAALAAVLFAPARRRARYGALARRRARCPVAGQLAGLAGFDVDDTKGHQGDRVLFSKWNSFSRIGVYERTHGDWSLSPTYTGRCRRRASWTSTRRLDADPPSRAATSRTRSTCATSSPRWRITLTEHRGSARPASERVHGARDRPGRRTRPGVGPRLRRARTSTASRSTRSSPTT